MEISGKRVLVTGVDNMAYDILVLRKKFPGLCGVLKVTGPARMHCYLNMYDIVYVIARKG